MAWTNLINSLFLPGKPILGSTGLALRDNPIAIAQGTSGAPRIAPRALETLYLGGSNGIGSGYAFTILNADSIGVIDAQINWATGAGDQIVFQASTNGGSTWGTQQAIMNSSLNGSGRMMVNLLTGAWRIHAASVYSGTLTIPSGCNAVRFKPDAGAGGGTTLAMMAFVAAGIPS